MSLKEVVDFNEENNNKFIKFIENKLSIKITEKFKQLFIIAITTPSFAKIYNENRQNLKENKEQISDYDLNEFKGDSIATYITVVFFNDKKIVGEANKKKEKEICNKNMTRVFNNIDFEKYIYMQDNQDLKDSQKADIIESLIYALHQNEFDDCKHFIKKYLVSLE